MDKIQARSLYKKKRAGLSEVEIEEKSLAIANRLLSLPIWDRSFYHLFLSIAHHKEVDTFPLLNILNGKDKNIVVSKSDFGSHGMQHFLLTDNTVLKSNAWGIPEPVIGSGSIEIPVEKLDVVFVPLLAFGKTGHRIGYGKGFYDRFLAQCRLETLKIGLSFFKAEEKLEGFFDTDVQLDYCVTPDQVYFFNHR